MTEEEPAEVEPTASEPEVFPVVLEGTEGSALLPPPVADDPLIVEPAGPGPESTPPWAAGLVAMVEGLADRLDRRLDALQSRFDRDGRAEANREKVVDRLHAELQEYKQDLLLNTLRPVFVDLIQLHDDMGKVPSSEPEATPEVTRLVGLMEGFRQGIEDILYRQGVEPFEGEGETFDPRRQRAVATVPTDDPALNKAIAARLRRGFVAGERVIRPEIVSVYSLRK